MLRKWLALVWTMFSGRGTTSSGKMVLYLLRGCFLAIIIGGAQLAFLYFRGRPYFDDNLAVITLVSILVVGFLVVAIDVLVPSKQITTISAVYFGLVLGVLLGTLFSTALDPLISDRQVFQGLRLLMT